MVDKVAFRVIVLIEGEIISELLKAVEAAARKLASTMAARDVVQRSLDGIIAEQERRAAMKTAAGHRPPGSPFL